MPERSQTFSIEEEQEASIKTHATSCNVVLLCIIAPFTPLRVAPERELFAQFTFPDEFVIEEFIERVAERYPDRSNRPPLHILIHSPGGTVSSSYVTARVLRENFTEIVGFVPHLAASGATVLSLACNKLIFGNISRFTGIDPKRGSFAALSVIRAFNRLEELLGTKTEGEISYPYKHLLKSITAEKYDEATRMVSLVDGYARELMTMAGYNEEEMRKILHGLLYAVEAHEQVMLLDAARRLGLRVNHYKDAGAKITDCWKVAKSWLQKYYLQPSPTHIIKYCLPTNGTIVGEANKPPEHLNHSGTTKET